MQATILPQNDGVGHSSRTDENIRPGQARIESTPWAACDPAFRVVSFSLAPGPFWQYNASGKGESDLWIATTYMSAPAPEGW